MSKFIIKTSAAAMPESCWGRYRRVAVLEVEDGAPTPKMISTRARGVVRIVRVWEDRHVGKTSRCAYDRALAEAEEMVARLNG